MDRKKDKRILWYSKLLQLKENCSVIDRIKPSLIKNKDRQLCADLRLKMKNLVNS